MYIRGWNLFALCNVSLKWFAISGEEMLGVDNYHILYYSRGIEGQPLYQMYGDCRKIDTFVLLTYLSFLCIALSTIVSSLLVSVVHFQCWLSFWYHQSFLNITYPSDIGDLSWFWLFCLGPFALLLPKLWVIWLSNLSILSDFDCRLKAQQSLCLYVVLTMPTLNKAYLFIYLFIWAYLMKVILETCLHTKFDIYVFIITLTLINIFYVQNVLVEVKSTGTRVRDIQVFDS
jgi:hypothetical protein